MSFFVDLLTRVNDVGGPPQQVGEFRTRDEAFAASRRSIDEFLSREFRPGMSAKKLYEQFREHGAVPFIFGGNDGSSDLLHFNPVKYALERSEEICGDVLTQS